MDYAAIAGGMEQAIPFNVHLGLRVVEVGPGLGVVELPEDPNLVNHVGSQHAGGLFSAGEAASGGAFVGTFIEKMEQITPLASAANIVYRKIARGPITATARLEDAEAHLEELEADCVTRFPVSVELTDAEGSVVAEMTVDWHVRAKA
jgi:acyl-coenzyme A thioesterase PaaI-like protein